MEGYPYKSDNGVDFDPVAQQDHNLAIHYVDGVHYRKVVFFEPIAPFQVINLGALAANITGALTNLGNLDMYDKELGQFRWWCIDNAQIRFFLPRTVTKQDLKNLQPPVDPSIVFENPSLNLTEFYVWQDNRPAVQAISGGVALAAVRVKAKGYRFQLEPLWAKSHAEKQALRAIQAERQIPGPLTKTQEADLMEALCEEKRVAVTEIWASARGGAANRSR